MFRVPFKGGHFNGADFTFTDRLPVQVELTIDCHADIHDEALEANLEPEERNLLILIRNAEFIGHKYELDTGSEGKPFYRYVSWSAIGSHR